ncbi:MAG: hypothetical protein DRO39_07525 [Thermoprotei archaeon]|nr:MAG: hypothetical protein DRO39_07525 [Thermoprotei archaeon]
MVVKWDDLHGGCFGYPDSSGTCVIECSREEEEYLLHELGHYVYFKLGLKGDEEEFAWNWARKGKWDRYGRRVR